MRILDLALSLIAIWLLSPVFLVIFMLLKLTGEGEIFYLQNRIGWKGKSFSVIKFATMQKNSPFIGSGSITSKNDPRILPVGRFLRKTKINELPQLINVLKGEMSIIGPRPHVKRDLQGVNPEHLSVLAKMRPGISGIASIYFRNEERILQKYDDPRPVYDGIIAPFKAELECYYYDHYTIKNYIKLISLTLIVVFFGNSMILYRWFVDLPKPSQSLLEIMQDET